MKKIYMKPEVKVYEMRFRHQILAGSNPSMRIGVKSVRRDSVGMVLTQIHDGDYTMVRNVSFANGTTRFTASAASESKGGTIELRLDRIDGQLIGRCEVGCTHGLDKWQRFSCDVKKVGGRHDLYLVFKGSHKAQLFEMDGYVFE